MADKEVSATSGRFSGPTANTGAQKVEASTWTSRSVSITVSASNRGERLVSLNDRLRGSSSRSTTTSE